jgi:type IV pilus assembly protein PilB
MPKQKLGEILHKQGKISREALERAIQEQAGKEILLGEILLKNKLVTKSDLVRSLEEVSRVPYLDATAAAVDADALRLIPYAMAKRYCTLPILCQGKKLQVLMERPHDLTAVQQLEFVTGYRIETRFGFREEILAAIAKYYEVSSTPLPSAKVEDDSAIEFVSSDANQRNLDSIREFQAELSSRPTPAVEMVSSMIREAVERKASDIHIDPQVAGSVVRIRIDGILQDIMEIPLRLQESVVSRIKIIADMDIAERRAPQDGRIGAKIGPERRDLRVSTLPTQYGEKVVIRLLDARSAFVGFQDLGLWEEHADLLGSLLKVPNGMILVTGPTGSGKTTTLYASLNFLRSRTLNIITVEDPVEYRLEGVNQVQVNEKAGRTFAASLRSILRQDPNVIMVGEIRDSETAEIGLRAAQTGHLVLSTMHTRDSATAIARLLDLGIAPFLIASTMTAVIAQRLVRRLCDCRAEAAVSSDYKQVMENAAIPHPRKTMFIPVGCQKCGQTGYRGRVGIYEILVFDDALGECVRSNAGVPELRRVASENGMRSLAADALLKVAMGLSTLEEVSRVVAVRAQPSNQMSESFSGAEDFSA